MNEYDVRLDILRPDGSAERPIVQRERARSLAAAVYRVLRDYRALLARDNAASVVVRVQIVERKPYATRWAASR